MKLSAAQESALSLLELHGGWLPASDFKVNSRTVSALLRMDLISYEDGCYALTSEPDGPEYPMGYMQGRGAA